MIQTIYREATDQESIALHHSNCKDIAKEKRNHGGSEGEQYETLDEAKQDLGEEMEMFYGSTFEDEVKVYSCVPKTKPATKKATIENCPKHHEIDSCGY